MKHSHFGCAMLQENIAVFPGERRNINLLLQTEGAVTIKLLNNSMPKTFYFSNMMGAWQEVLAFYPQLSSIMDG